MATALCPGGEHAGGRLLHPHSRASAKVSNVYGFHHSSTCSLATSPNSTLGTSHNSNLGLADLTLTVNSSSLSEGSGLQVTLPPRASGHVERFSDWMVKDVVTGECYRADHLLEETLEKLLADPKLSAEKAAEYRHVIRQVCVCVCVCVCVYVCMLSQLDRCLLAPD